MTKSIRSSLYNSLKQADYGDIPPCLTDFYPVNKKFEENKLVSIYYSSLLILNNPALMDGQTDNSRLIVFLRENGIYYTVSLPKKLKLKTYHTIAQDYISQIKISRYLSHDLELYLTNFDNQ